VEIGAGIATAYCGLLLAGLGAEVLKLEPPGGDSTRYDGPFPGDRPDPERSARFLHLNRGKRSVVLARETAAGRHALRALQEGAAEVLDDHPAAEPSRPGSRRASTGRSVAGADTHLLVRRGWAAVGVAG
jgi:crotonobetainyl-CoA:carnitine CoA-transferase CaiB-like acyl-CoA transferase